MTARFEHTDELRGAVFEGVDLTGAVFRNSDLSGAIITGSAVDGLRVSPHAGDPDRVVVDGVDVTEYVRDELDRRHPERIRLRSAETPGDYRAMWTVLEELWSDTIARAERLPEAVRHERVGGEWSFVETLRHLVFAVDVWLGRMVGGEALPFHPLGLPPDDYPGDRSRALGIDIAARPSYAEAVKVHSGRMAMMRDALEDLDETEFARVVSWEPAPGWGVTTCSVGHCLHVVLHERCEHRRFALRDLAILEAR